VIEKSLQGQATILGAFGEPSSVMTLIFVIAQANRKTGKEAVDRREVSHHFDQTISDVCCVPFDCEKTATHEARRVAGRVKLGHAWAG